MAPGSGSDFCECVQFPLVTREWMVQSFMDLAGSNTPENLGEGSYGYAESPILTIASMVPLLCDLAIDFPRQIPHYKTTFQPTVGRMHGIQES